MPNENVTSNIKTGGQKETLTTDPTDDIFEFHMFDCNSYHEKGDDFEDKYIIQLFGRTADDKDVCIKVVDFEPFFYVKLPLTFKQIQIKKLIDAVKRRVKYVCESKYDYPIEDDLTDYRVLRKYNFFNFSNKKLENFLRLKFKSYTAMKEFSRAFASKIKFYDSTDAIKYDRFECNIEPHIRFIHIQKLLSAGWVDINRKNLKSIPLYSKCDYTYEVKWSDVHCSKNQDRMAPFKILGYDIECVSSGPGFPQAKRDGDKIVQIGLTLYRYGSMKCEQEWLLNLGPCLKKPGVIIKCYKNERALLKGWSKVMNIIRPDIKCGYNNFGFDDMYIHKRIKKLDQLKARKNNVPVQALPITLEDKIKITMGKLNNKYIMDTESLTSSLTTYDKRQLSSAGLGENYLKFYQIPGTVSIDVMKDIKRVHSLPCYKLDYVASNFITEKILGVDFSQASENIIHIYSATAKALDINSYIQIIIRDGYDVSNLVENSKYKVIDIVDHELMKNDKMIKCKSLKISMNKSIINLLANAYENKLTIKEWTFSKDDVDYKDINRWFRTSNIKGITKVGLYCIKDCKLVNILVEKLQILVSNMAMANVCCVPLSYLFLRGQGVKIYSLVSKKCREKNFLIPLLSKVDLDNLEGYEGATVIEPIPGVYSQPIAVLDYSSLYPNSMREMNYSPECYIDPTTLSKYLNLSNYVYHTIDIVLKDSKGRVIKDIDGNPKVKTNTFVQEIVDLETIHSELADIIKALEADRDYGISQYQIGKHVDEKTTKLLDTLNRPDVSVLTQIDIDLLIEHGMKTCNNKINLEISKKYNIVGDKYVRYGILPEILTELLNKRKDTNNKLAIETDAFTKTILNALQLAFKITANSLYGQTGAKTSAIYFLTIAESTCALGRKRLYFARDIVESNFPNAKIIYGDTDSIFINFGLVDENGNPRTDRSALIETIKLAKQAAALINSSVPKPQSITYEKTLHPFILLSKKRYVGLLYEHNPDEYYMKCMGIVLKRRDNAPIVKIVVGGIIDNILINRNIEQAVSYAEKTIGKLVSGLYDMDKFIISKTLRSNYAKPWTIAHKALADRMCIRDPGNAPQINDRIPFVYIYDKKISAKKKILQSDVVENPDYVKAHGLQIDYIYYLEHQIMKPASQVLSLILPEAAVTKMFNKYILNESRIRSGVADITTWAIKGTVSDNIMDIPALVNKKICNDKVRSTQPKSIGKRSIVANDISRWCKPKK